MYTWYNIWIPHSVLYVYNCSFTKLKPALLRSKIDKFKNYIYVYKIYSFKYFKIYATEKIQHTKAKWCGISKEKKPVGMLLYYVVIKLCSIISHY